MNKKKMIWLLGFLIVVGGFAAYFLLKNKSSAEFRLGTISKGNLTLKILSTGTVQPENRLQIKSPISGRVDRVLVKEGDNVKKGQIIAWLSSNERAALIDAARSQGGKEVSYWEELYKPTPLVAPLSGQIILRSVESGQTFTTSDVVFVMSDRLTIKAQVDETDLAQIHLKQKAEVTLDAFPERVLPAVVDQIAFEAKTVNNVTTYLIDVLPDENINTMRSGMTANVTFVGKTRENILLIPNEFIKYENGKPLAMLKTERAPVARDLKLGITDGRNTEVESGLEEGDVVVLVVNRKDSKGNSNPFSPMGSGPRRGAR